MIACSHCDTANTVEARFCSGCGAPLGEQPLGVPTSRGTAGRPASEPAMPPVPPPPAFNLNPAAPRKSRVLAVALEALGGLAGLLGLGWMYAGQMGLGLGVLIGFIVANVILLGLDVLTAGLFLCIHAPLGFAAIITSAVLVYRYTRQHEAEFA